MGQTRDPVGQGSFLEGVLKCMGKRWAPLEAGRRSGVSPFAPRTNETFAERKATKGFVRAAKGDTCFRTDR